MLNTKNNPKASNMETGSVSIHAMAMLFSVAKWAGFLKIKPTDVRLLGVDQLERMTPLGAEIMQIICRLDGDRYVNPISPRVKLRQHEIGIVNAQKRRERAEAARLERQKSRAAGSVRAVVVRLPKPLPVRAAVCDDWVPEQELRVQRLMQLARRTA